MRPSHNWKARIVTIIAAVVTVTVSVMDQKSSCPPNGCSRPSHVPRSVSLVLTENFEQVDDISSHCFPFNTTLLYVCKAPDSQQFLPTFHGNLLSRRCTGHGWLDDNGLSGNKPPKCVKRQRHCFFPPIPIVPHVFVQIDNLNVSDGRRSSVNPGGSYSEGTIATYKCMDPKLPETKTVEQTWRCVWYQQLAGVASWRWVNLTTSEFVCDVPERGTDYSVTTASTGTTSPSTSTSNSGAVVVIDEIYQQRTTKRKIIIGICTLMALGLIAILLGVFCKNRLAFDKRYGYGDRHASQPSLTLS